MTKLEELHRFLSALPPGHVTDYDLLSSLVVKVSDAWEERSPSYAVMKPEKVLERLADANWQPPILKFSMVPARGSSRVRRQGWGLNIKTMEAKCLKPTPARFPGKFNH